MASQTTGGRAKHAAENPASARPLVRFAQRHERALIAAWLGGCALLLTFLGLWGVALGGAERAVDSWDRSWLRELDRLESEVAAGGWESAAPALERLDRDQPA